MNNNKKIKIEKPSEEELDNVLLKCIAILEPKELYFMTSLVILYTDYQKRIDKAIEYIEHTEPFIIVHTIDGYWEKLRNKTKKDLLDILRGNDERNR